MNINQNAKKKKNIFYRRPNGNKTALLTTNACSPVFQRDNFRAKQIERKKQQQFLLLFKKSTNA